MNLDIDEVMYPRQLTDRGGPALQGQIRQMIRGFSIVIGCCISRLVGSVLQYGNTLRQSDWGSNVSNIDRAAYMQAASHEVTASGLLYFPTNLHITRRGRAVIAERLISQLSGEDGIR